MDLDGDKLMTVNFEPPIVGFELKPSPPRISLVDTCDLVLRLVDDQGRPIATKARRTVSFALESGRGEFSAGEVPIEPDRSSARVTFTPVWWGPMAVTASTPNLVNVTASSGGDASAGIARVLPCRRALRRLRIHAEAA